MRELSEKERLLLVDLLDAAHKEKLHELHHASTVSYKLLLKEKIDLIEALVTEFAQPGVAG
jgi:hypothetical protein